MIIAHADKVILAKVIQAIICLKIVILYGLFHYKKIHGIPMNKFYYSINTPVQMLILQHFIITEFISKIFFNRNYRSCLPIKKCYVCLCITNKRRR